MILLNKVSERIKPQVLEVEDQPREACGVFGVYSKESTDLASVVYMGLLDLQHRGQDGAGIAVHDGQNFVIQKEEGLVSSVFNEGKHLSGLPEGSVAVGHARYGTSNNGDNFNALQPLYSSVKNGFVVAHNGHIDEFSQIAGERTDTEYLIELINRKLDTGKTLVGALKSTLQDVKGAYSLVVSDGTQLIGARDPWGFRPLSVAYNEENYFFSSEDSALRATDLAVRDVAPGEMVIINEDGLSNEWINSGQDHTTCGLEFAYFSRPDSNIDGINVQESREKMGRLLAKSESPNFEADMVVGVPDSGVAAAFGYAEASNIPLKQAITKNRYISRTFIKAAQADRERAVGMKLHPNKALIEGKRLVVIDDSIVRGTTTRALVAMLRESGAREVHLRISWPPYKWPCYYGMDTGNPEELIANRMNKSEMEVYIGVDSLNFLSENGIKEATQRKVGGVCLACVDADYPTSR